MFCKFCGKEIADDAVICVHCGRQVGKMAEVSGPEEGKSWLVTLLLCLFVGCLGGHRFYTGYIGIGIVQLLTAGGCGVWTLIDFIMILCNNFKTANGETLTK